VGRRVDAVVPDEQNPAHPVLPVRSAWMHNGGGPLGAAVLPLGLSAADAGLTLLLPAPAPRPARCRTGPARAPGNRRQHDLAERDDVLWYVPAQADYAHHDLPLPVHECGGCAVVDTGDALQRLAAGEQCPAGSPRADRAPHPGAGRNARFPDASRTKRRVRWRQPSRGSITWWSGAAAVVPTLPSLRPARARGTRDAASQPGGVKLGAGARQAPGRPKGALP
jgi:hypothetical protein